MIEAVFEDMAVKKDVFAKLGKTTKLGANPGDEHVLSEYR